MKYEFISIVLLTAPLIWELLDDRKGDFNKAQDVIWRVLIAMSAASTIWILEFIHRMHHGFFQSIFLALSIHFMFFDYGINLILGHKKDWFSYMGKKGVIDNYPLWHNLDPRRKLMIKLLIFLMAIIWYV